MSRYKKLTLLHSNDLHGDFSAETLNETLVGGVSMLSGYIDKVRKEEKNTLYCIAGDMFRGSIIDSEFKGMSTIEIMNAIAPDVVTLGNHETDYGIAHLLFLEKCARFPIINANLYIKSNFARLFTPQIVLEVDGMKILFIGVLTEEVLAQARQEKLIGAIVDVREAATEVGKICNAYQTEDIDLTVLLTHIGFDEDKRLAELLDPRWGVDVIIGTHPHTLQPIVFDDMAGTLVAYSLGDFFGEADRGATNYSIILDIEITKDDNAGITRVTDYSYTPIYTVREGDVVGNKDRRVVRIEKALEAYQDNFLDKITEATAEGMKKAMTRIPERMATAVEVTCPGCDKAVEVYVNGKSQTLVADTTCKCGQTLSKGSKASSYK